MHRYEVIIFWSEEDQVFVAEVPELPGCMTHGETYEKAVTMAQDAMRGWISVAREFGDPVPKPSRRKLSTKS